MHILYGLAAIAIGIIAVWKSYQIVMLIGHMETAEKYLGPGGSYTAWKLIGIALVIGGIWELVKG
jgi:hypothetical protein